MGDVPTCHTTRPQHRENHAHLRRSAWASGVLFPLLVFPLLVVGGAPAELLPHELKIAFIGDQGRGAGALAVLQLIASEGADAVVHSGDFDYNDDPARWNALIDSVLGADFPYFACIGNHDASRYYGSRGYQEFIQERMLRLGIPWTGDLGVQSEFSWRGIHFVMTAPGIVAAGDGLYDLYIRERFAASEAAWRISIWHKNQHLMQAGGKSDESGWRVYEESRRAGAIIATGHEHSYSRTHLLSSMGGPAVADASGALVLGRDDPATPEDEGRSFAFVSGLGGQSIRDQEVFGDWFASVYSSTQGANHGALFGVFHVQGNPRLAHFYFKDIDGTLVDEFTVRSSVGGGEALYADAVGAVGAKVLDLVRRSFAAAPGASGLACAGSVPCLGR
jgi:predicted phosphodiesterase